MGAATQEPGHGTKFKVEVLALGLDMLPPGQFTVEVKAEVLDVGFYRDRGSVQEHRRAVIGRVVKVTCADLAGLSVFSTLQTSRGGGISGVGGVERRLQDQDGPKEPRVIRESSDGGGVRRGLICGEEEVEKRAKNTALGDTRSHHMAGWQVEHVVLYRTWK